LFDEQWMQRAIGGAKGMVFLAKNNIIHRDLSARNLLVNEYNVVKVSDFGMSRGLGTDGAYKLTNQVLPFRWTAPEVFKFLLFTTMSDVWSFGIVLWEIFEFGAVPYMEMSTEQVVNGVLNGKRLQQPRKCPDAVFHIMKRCWEEEPNDRITFPEILDSLLNIAGDKNSGIAIEQQTKNESYGAFKTYGITQSIPGNESPQQQIVQRTFSSPNQQPANSIVQYQQRPLPPNPQAKVAFPPTKRTQKEDSHYNSSRAATYILTNPNVSELSKKI